MTKIFKNSIGNFLVTCLIFVLVFAWLFSGWPRIWQNPPIPPKIQEVQADTDTSIYNFVGVTNSNHGDGINPIAIEHDSDVFPWTVSGDQNDSAYPSDTEYSNISANNTAQWETDDPGYNNYIAITFRFYIQETISAISNIEITWNGNTDDANGVLHSIHLRKDGLDEFGGTNTWVKLGGDTSINQDVDTDVIRDLTSDFSTYINSTTGSFEFVVTHNKSTSNMRTNYIQIVVTYTIAPSITLTVDSPTKSLGNITPGTPVTASTIATITTNNSTGYSLKISDNVAGSDSALLHTDTATRIADYAGTIASPTFWSGTGLGICVYAADTSKEAKWGTGTTETDSNNKYAGIPQAATEIHNVGSAVTNDDTNIGYKLNVPSNQKTGAYSGVVIYSAVVN